VEELLALRGDGTGRRLPADEDILIGTTLAHFYEHQLDEPGKAMLVHVRPEIDIQPGAGAPAVRGDRPGLADLALAPGEIWEPTRGFAGASPGQ
jgi:hypothetical protein